MVQSPRISVIVPAYNAASSIESTHASVSRQTREPYEVIVVADGSSNESDGIARTAGATVLEGRSNTGASGTRNAGISETPGDVRDAFSTATHVHLAITCCAAVRRDVALELAGFDADIRYGEDSDFGLRLAARHPVACTDEITVRCPIRTAGRGHTCAAPREGQCRARYQMGRAPGGVYEERRLFPARNLWNRLPDPVRNAVRRRLRGGRSRG